jgi:hypothetical protein
MLADPPSDGGAGFEAFRVDAHEGATVPFDRDAPLKTSSRTKSAYIRHAREKLSRTNGFSGGAQESSQPCNADKAMPIEPSDIAHAICFHRELNSPFQLSLAGGGRDTAT